MSPKRSLLAADVIEIITVFSARLYGSRSHKTRRMLEDLKSGTLPDPGTIITKAADPGEGPVGDLLRAMEATQLRAMVLYAGMLEARDASRP
jgi:hypothetical protein